MKTGLPVKGSAGAEREGVTAIDALGRQRGEGLLVAADRLLHQPDLH